MEPDDASSDTGDGVSVVEDLLVEVTDGPTPEPPAVAAPVDHLFYGLSSAADHGLLWLTIGALRAARRGDPAIAARLGAIMGIESALTNGVVKSFFRRVRPDRGDGGEGPLPYGMHRPITSSFPSGHAASAFTAATVLARDPFSAAGYYALASLVAYSRVHTKMHHGADIVAGAALGLALGLVARRVLPLGGRTGRATE